MGLLVRFLLLFFPFVFVRVFEWWRQKIAGCCEFVKCQDFSGSLKKRLNKELMVYPRDGTMDNSALNSWTLYCHYPFNILWVYYCFFLCTCGTACMFVYICMCVFPKRGWTTPARDAITSAFAHGGGWTR